MATFTRDRSYTTPQLYTILRPRQGIGLAPEEPERIFDTFYRGRSEVMHRRRSIGVGLAVCRQIVEAHGGRIWAESPGPGRGTTVSFTLPRQA